MMCHRIGRSPISTMGLGLSAVSSARRVPKPPARMTTFISVIVAQAFCWYCATLTRVAPRGDNVSHRPQNPVRRLPYPGDPCEWCNGVVAVVQHHGAL